MMDKRDTHDFWMQRCLTLAARGLGGTAPNPLVGCVIVRNECILAEGWHHRAGEPHAEVEAIRAMGEGQIPSDATVYVNLEPCAHFGKTPPCANLLLERGASRIVVAMQDPFPDVHGKGLELLRQSGVHVLTGVLEAEATWLNRRFLSAVTRNRPWVILKWAETADGYMADESGIRRQISGPSAQLLLHRWRSEEGAFLVGKNTVIHDNPLLTNRLYGEKQPVRIVVDPKLELPAYMSVFNNQAQTWVLNEAVSRISGNLRWMAYGHNLFPVLFDAMHEDGSNSLVVEGGPVTLQRFLNSGYADEIRILRSKKQRWGSGIPAPAFHGTLRETQALHDDDVFIYSL